MVPSFNNTSSYLLFSKMKGGDNFTSTESLMNTTVLYDNTTEIITAEPSTSRSAAALLPPLILLILNTCIGNIIVMLCTRVEKRLRNVSNLYVFSLAMADCLVGATVMVGMLVYTLEASWPLGTHLCTLWVGLDFTCCTVSMLHLCLIAYDRYVALVHPLIYRNQHTTKGAIVRITAAWIISLLVWIPAIVAFQATGEQVEGDCFFLPHRLYILIQALFVYYGPIVIMSYFYIMCLHVLRMRYKKTASEVAAGANAQGIWVSSGTSGDTSYLECETYSTLTAGNNSNTAEVSGEGQHLQLPSNGGSKQVHNHQKVSKKQQQMRSIRTLGVVMLVFLFCWLPFCLFWPIAAYCPDCIPMQAYEYSYWAAYLNSTVNPWLYFLSNKDFRGALKKLVNIVKDKFKI